MRRRSTPMSHARGATAMRVVNFPGTRGVDHVKITTGYPSAQSTNPVGH